MKRRLGDEERKMLRWLEGSVYEIGNERLDKGEVDIRERREGQRLRRDVALFRGRRRERGIERGHFRERRSRTAMMEMLTPSGLTYYFQKELRG